MRTEGGLKTMAREAEGFINLGKFGVRIRFKNNNLYDYALKHIFLSKSFDKHILGEIEYIEDESTSDMIKAPYPPNSIYIKKDVIGENKTRMLLKMFNQHTISIIIREGNAEVRYPSAMPGNYLLEDILQLALHPILEQIGGFILHGSCVAKDSNAIVLMGASGSGKSTTAYNLTRVGFRCYSDDAVLVTPNEQGLYVWPFDREISLRPLSFRLFEQQDIINYNKDERKYYFAEDKEDISGCGAFLKFICFLELSGEGATKIVQLSCEEALKKLLNENHHFSFAGREHSEVFADRLSKKGPLPLSAFIGIDFNSQWEAFDALFSESRTADSKKKVPPPAGRTEKMEMIRNSWLSKGEEPLSKLIPLLGDMDIKVAVSAISFFRNYPLAHIEPIQRSLQKTADFKKFDSAPSSTDWLRTKDWIEGGRKLIAQSKKEVIENFASDWMGAAPILYPFLKIFAHIDQDKYKFVENGWKQYKQKNMINDLDKSIHVADFPSNAMLSIAELNKDSIKKFSETGHVYIYFWLTLSSRKEWELLAKTLRMHKDILTLTALPLDNGDNSALTASAEFIKLMAAYGIRPEISRLIPPCLLGVENVQIFTEIGSFLGRTTDALMRHITGDGNEDIKLFKDIGVEWIESPFPECENCIITDLGLCAGHLIKRRRS